MNINEIKDRIENALGFPYRGKIEFKTDNAEYIDITRGMVLTLDNELYFILGNMFESRFTLEEYPKYWVKSAIELATGKKRIIKWVFNEEFVIQIGVLNIKCYRSPIKEEEILNLTRDHPFFMQGKTAHDSIGKSIRILDYIEGKSLYRYLLDLNMSHEEYFYTVYPSLLCQLKKCMEGIALLHKNNYFHGDIRNDHLILDQNSGNYKWIDFDLNQDFSDFDIWSLGNILLFSTGKNEHTFHNITNNKEISKAAINSLQSNDASAFFKHRIINLRKLFPYIPKELNNILMHFSINTNVFYDRVEQIVNDVNNVLEQL